jgi:hypothetical protein
VRLSQHVGCAIARVASPTTVILNACEESLSSALPVDLFEQPVKLK